MRALAPSDGMRTLVGIAAAALLLLMLTLPLLAARIDRQSARYETRLVAAGYAGATEAFADLVTADAVWDALLRHTASGVDTSWLDDNVITSNPSDPMSGIVVVADGANRLAYAREHSQPIGPARWGHITQVLTPLLARLRTLERAGGGDASGGRGHNTGDRARLTTTALIDGTAYIASAQRVDAATADFVRLPGAKPVLLAAAPLSDKVLPAVINNLALQSPVLRTGTQQNPRPQSGCTTSMEA